MFDSRSDGLVVDELVPMRGLDPLTILDEAIRQYTTPAMSWHYSLVVTIAWLQRTLPANTHVFRLRAISIHRWCKSARWVTVSRSV